MAGQESERLPPVPSSSPSALSPMPSPWCNPPRGPAGMRLVVPDASSSSGPVSPIPSESVSSALWNQGNASSASRWPSSSSSQSSSGEHFHRPVRRA